MGATNHIGSDRRLTLKVAAIACVISFFFVVLHLWDNRDLFDPEGISYLDIADAYRRGDWHAALAGIWSPMYTWLLALVMMVFNPSAQWEFTGVHALNVVIYLFALASFSVFLRELPQDRRRRGREPAASELGLGRPSPDRTVRQGTGGPGRRYIASQRISSSETMPPAASSSPVLTPKGSSFGW